ncbi:MAG: ABC transporter permease [Thermoplasmata archaeon]|nr:ABC transporter permease [Thermoplasmata archaeon]
MVGTSSPSSPATRTPESPLVVFWRVLRANPLSFFGFLLVALLGCTALVVLVAPGLVVPYGALQQTADRNVGPSSHHLLGTDNLGRDIFSNVMLALPLDLGIGFAIAGSALLLGGALGLIAGFYDTPGTVFGWLSVSIMRVTDIFLSFPSLILALALTRVLGLGVGPTVLAITLTWWPFYVRLVRGEVLAVKHRPYVNAARAAGVTENRILLRHVLRTVLEPVIVYFTLDIGTVLVTYSTIGFIGVASKYPGPQPEWGAMLAFYQQSGSANIEPWLVIGPGAAIFVTVLAFSLLGDGLRDILDPRTRRAFVRSTSAHDPPASAAPGRPSDADEAESVPEPLAPLAAVDARPIG